MYNILFVLIFQIGTLPLLLQLTDFTTNNHKSLNDSIKKYTETNQDKALSFGLDVLDNVNFIRPDMELVSTYNLIGEILTDKSLYLEALNYFSEALRVFKLVPVSQLKEQNINSPPWVLLNLSNLFYVVGDIESAKIKLSEAKDNFLLYNDINSRQVGLNTVNTNLGLFATAQGDYKLAESIYLEVLINRKNSNDLQGEMFTYFQLIDLFLFNPELFYKSSLYFEKATTLYHDFNNNLLEHKQNDQASSWFTRNYGYIFIAYSKYYMSINDFENALIYLSKANDLLLPFPLEISKINTLTAQCLFGLNEFTNATKLAKFNLKNNSITPFYEILNYKTLESIYTFNNDITNLLKTKDVLIKLSQNNAPINIKSMFLSLETQSLLIEKQSELTNNRVRYNTYIFILVIVFSVLLFLFISIRVNYLYQKKKNTILEQDKDLTTITLEKKELELVSKTAFISQRNIYLDILKQSILNHNIKYPDNSKSSISIEKEIDRIIGTVKIFENFESQFTNVHPDFFKNLVIKYGKLSQNDLRLCAYIKMNQSTNQISQMTGVSIRTVETQRYRLSKKLKLLDSEDLNFSIMSI